MTQPTPAHRCQHKAFRLTCEEFDALYAAAGGCCELCGIPEAETPRGVLVIDHDHSREWESGCVRALVCDQCNALVKQIDALGPDVIADAKQAAARHNTNLSEVVRAALERFVRDSEESP